MHSFKKKFPLATFSPFFHSTLRTHQPTYIYIYIYIPNHSIHSKLCSHFTFNNLIICLKNKEPKRKPIHKHEHLLIFIYSINNSDNDNVDPLLYNLKDICVQNDVSKKRGGSVAVRRFLWYVYMYISLSLSFFSLFFSCKEKF